MSKAKFITLEGVDGAGKSTHIDFIKSYFELKSLEHIVTREPGGTVTGEKIREMLLNDEISPITESLLMFAARSEHLSLVIYPNLRNEVTVISDRFTDATYAYQSGGKYVDTSKITILKDWVHKDLIPDLTILFDLPIEVSMDRLNKVGDLDKFEKKEKSFHERIRKSYLELAKNEQSRFKVINSNQNINTIQKEIHLILDEIFK